MGLQRCPTPSKSGFIWISALRMRQAVSCITPIWTLGRSPSRVHMSIKAASGLKKTAKIGASPAPGRLTVLLLDGGRRVADGVPVRWAGLRHWGLLSCDPCGLSGVHVLAAHRTVILHGERSGGGVGVGEKIKIYTCLTRTGPCSEDQGREMKDLILPV